MSITLISDSLRRNSRLVNRMYRNSVLIYQNVRSSASALFASVSQASFTYSGGTGQLSVTNNSGVWTATTSDNWITLSGNTGGTGTTTVNFTVSNNPDINRTGSITITNGIDSVTITITQSQFEIILTVNPDDIILDKDGNAVSVNITSNTNWEIDD